jgi:hypothetical protein
MRQIWALFRNQKSTRKRSLLNSSMLVIQFSENETVMHELTLTYIFCNIKVEVTALSSYEDKEELFKEQVDWISIYSIFSPLITLLPNPAATFAWKLCLLSFSIHFLFHFKRQRRGPRPNWVLSFPFSQVKQLRQRFFHSIDPCGLAADRRGVVPASGFCLSALQIWKVIRDSRVPLLFFCLETRAYVMFICCEGAVGAGSPP